MFSDSIIVKQFSTGKTKCACYLTYGMATYFKDIFLQSLKEVPLDAVSFDESYINILKQGQMDLHVRYWNSEKERVDIRYLNSLFMGKSAEVDVLEYFNSCVESVEKKAKFYKFSLMGQM